MKLNITSEAYLKLKYYIGLVDTEISGMGKSQRDTDGNILMTDLVIFDQEVSGASTNIDEQSMAKFINELMKNNERTEDWNIWWHSHADMEVFWSQTDDKTIIDHAGGQSYLISLVGNRKKKYKARIDIFPKDTSPFNYTGIHYNEDLDIEILSNESNTDKILELEYQIDEAKKQIQELSGHTNPEVRKQCQFDIDNKVKEKVYPKYNNYNTLYNGRGKKHNKNNKWKWTGENQEALIDVPVNYSLLDGYDDDYYGAQDNPYTRTCSVCGWSKTQCAEMNNCSMSKIHQEDLNLI